MKLSEELLWRGFHAETTVKDPAILDTQTHKFYLGADPSADSLTIGNLAALMMCACFARHGYEPHLLVGGATGQIGDPKENGERELKSIEEIEHNKACIAEQMQRVWKLAAEASGIENAAEAPVFDNYSWFKDISYLDFLRNVGKSFSMTQLLDRKFIQSRIGEGGSGISYAEFSYTLIQGYDFWHLYRNYGIDLQICGADQYGNASSGIHLIRRFENAEANVWSTPLVIDPVTGRKFGKSEGNAVWLAATDNGQGNFTPVFDFYQFWLNQPDESVDYLLKIYTVYEREVVEQISADHAAAPEKRLAQKALARGVTEVVHGKEAAEAVESLSMKLFDKSAVLAQSDLEAAKTAFPSVERGINVVDALVETGLAASKTEARNFLKSGAISAVTEGKSAAESTKITDETTILSEPALLKRGKNRFATVK
ncbi:tyrosine--tRNA ligase [Candidatus Saccharibacteria bacterium]|nr:tyrosine--tRNA ligase [Candidatus Saccharibacteria bacterium]